LIYRLNCTFWYYIIDGVLYKVLSRSLIYFYEIFWQWFWFRDPRFIVIVFGAFYKTLGLICSRCNLWYLIMFYLYIVILRYIYRMVILSQSENSLETQSNPWHQLVLWPTCGGFRIQSSAELEGLDCDSDIYPESWFWYNILTISRSEVDSGTIYQLGGFLTNTESTCHPGSVSLSTLPMYDQWAAQGRTSHAPALF